MDRNVMRQRVLSRVTVADAGYLTPCWISDRAAHTGGYTKIGVDGRTELTHRLAYELFIGPIPQGLQLDHLCRVRSCCNPTHLEPVTCRENLLRGVGPSAMEAAQTHCLNGHEFTAVNTRLTAQGKRHCRPCDKARARAYRARVATTRAA